jgi:hypothetical protein
MKVGDIVRLKDLCNVEVLNLVREGEGPMIAGTRYAGNSLDVLKKGARIIHWVHPSCNIDLKVLMPDGTIRTGKCEQFPLATEKGRRRVVQFERFGFVNLIPIEGSKGYDCIFTHT